MIFTLQLQPKECRDLALFGNVEKVKKQKRNEKLASRIITVPDKIFCMVSSVRVESAKYMSKTQSEPF